MFRLLYLIKNLGLRTTIIILAIIGGGGILYSVLLAPKPPPYTRPAGYMVTMKCVTGGRDCDDSGFIKLWDSTQKTTSSFVRSPDAPFCVAEKSTQHDGKVFWWVDCGLWHGSELPIIEGWVQEANMIFGEWVESRKLY